VGAVGARGGAACMRVIATGRRLDLIRFRTVQIRREIIRSRPHRLMFLFGNCPRACLGVDRPWISGAQVFVFKFVFWRV
jgi:hypothetical protein